MEQQEDFCTCIDFSSSRSLAFAYYRTDNEYTLLTDNNKLRENEYTA